MVSFGVITAYPTEDWHSRRIVEECAARGRVTVHAPTDFALGTAAPSAADVDAWLLPRALGATGDPDFQLGVYAALEELGTPVVNPVGGLLVAEDKPRTSWLLAQAGLPTPPAIAVQSLAEAARAFDELGPAVLKPPYGSLGQGIVLLERWDEAICGGMLAEHGVIYLQRFVRPARGRKSAQDLRAFVVGDRVAGAMVRVAAPGEFRTNIHQGASARPIELDEATARIAVRATGVLGLEYAGVDLLETDDGPTVIEVNGTPLWQGILEATGRDMAEEIVAHAARLAAGNEEGANANG